MMKLKQIDWWFWTIIILSGLLIFTLSSCALLQPVGDFITGKPQPTITTPTTPANQLWHTVKKSNWITTLAIPIIALGAVAAFNGMIKLGMSAAIFGCVNLFMALATARFAMWMAVFGLIGSAVTVVASILVKNKALIEIVKGGQIFKNSNDETVLDSFKICQQEVQSKPTQKLVQNVKTKLKLKGEI